MQTLRLLVIGETVVLLALLVCWLSATPGQPTLTAPQGPVTGDPHAASTMQGETSRDNGPAPIARPPERQPREQPTPTDSSSEVVVHLPAPL